MQEGTFPSDTNELSLLFHVIPQSNTKKDKSKAEFRSVDAMSCGSLAHTQLVETQTHPAFRLSTSFLYQPFAEAVSSKLKLKGIFHSLSHHALGYRLSRFQLGCTTLTWH